MTSLKLKIFLLISAALILPRSVQGHDGWIQVNSIVEKGQPVSIALMHGNHSNEHGSFRLAGKWDAQYTKLLVIDPSGKISDLTNTIVDLGKIPRRPDPRVRKVFIWRSSRQKQTAFISCWLDRSEACNKGTGPNCAR